MKVLMWIGIVLLVLFIVYVTIFAAFSFYVSAPRTHNATAYNSKVSNQYYMQDGKVIFVTDGNFFQIGEKNIAGANYGTFEVIDQSYAKDINHIYFNGKPVAGAKPNNVTLVKSGLNINSANSDYLH